MRSPIRRPARPHVTALAAGALASALFLAGCSSGDGAGGNGADRTTAAAAAKEVLLQPLAAQGPDPFTASTAKATRPPATTPPDTPAPTATAGTVHEITGSTPGLYGGTHSVASCDVERQVDHLSADQGKARAFAEAAGIPEGSLADWLRGLTPVVLSADTRVTNHGYRDGGATAYQSVLQAGTAVLVDQYGAPRVRCACGNPLRSPAAAQGATPKGQPWRGYHPDRVVVIRPTTTVVTSLVIANLANNTWIERKTGTDGEQDTRPAVIPPCDPAACDLTGTPTPVPTPSVPDGSPPPGDPTPPAPPESDVPPPPPSPEPPVEPLPETEPAPESDGPSFEDLFPTDTAPEQPETFEG
ncbi:DUF6777 domain-containing protein [Streptomyces sp. NPDC054975]